MYQRIENESIFSSAETVRLHNGRYERKIYQDEACYSYWHVAFGYYMIKNDTLCLQKPDSIIYTNTGRGITKVMTLGKTFVFTYKELDQQWVSIIRASKELQGDPIFYKELSKTSFSIQEPTANDIKNFDSAYIRDLTQFFENFMPACLKIKKRKLIPLYELWGFGQFSRMDLGLVRE
ncbi:hypothetical protein GCM10028806_43640 [Spirosoma terrae]